MTTGEALAVATDLLRAAGWIEDGATDAKLVRTGDAQHPVYGGIGGRAVQLGGRARWHLPETDWYCTVGPRTCYVYRKAQHAVSEGTAYATRDADALRAALAAILAPVYRLTALPTVGCYYTDETGRAWATWQRMGGVTRPCDLCATPILSGYHAAATASAPELVICARHVETVYPPEGRRP